MASPTPPPLIDRRSGSPYYPGLLGDEMMKAIKADGRLVQGRWPGESISCRA